MWLNFDENRVDENFRIVEDQTFGFFNFKEKDFEMNQEIKKLTLIPLE